MKKLIILSFLVSALAASGQTNDTHFKSEVTLLTGFNVSTGMTLQLVSMTMRGESLSNEIEIITGPTILSNALTALAWSESGAASVEYEARESREYMGIIIRTKSAIPGRAQALAGTIAEQYIDYRARNPLISTNGERLDIRILERPRETMTQPAGGAYVSPAAGDPSAHP